MTPFRPMVIDNRAPGAQFMDANPISDGLANLFASAINAPIAAGQIRRQREQDDQAQARQDMLDRRAEDWRGQDLDRQAQQDAMAKVWRDAQIENMKADNARRLAEMFGNGLNNTARRGVEALGKLRGLFGGGAGGKAGAKPATAPKPVINDFGTTETPNWLQWNGQAWVPAIPKTMPTPENPVLPEETEAGPAGTFPEGPGSSFWTPHRSGEAGVGTAGDLLGGLWDGWTGNGVRQGRAGDPSVGGGQPVDQNRPPEWAAAKIDAGGIDAWHERARTNPLDFARKLAELKAAGDPRFPIIMAELRRRAGQ